MFFGDKIGAFFSACEKKSGKALVQNRRRLIEKSGTAAIAKRRIWHYDENINDQPVPDAIVSAG